MRGFTPGFITVRKDSIKLLSSCQHDVFRAFWQPSYAAKHFVIRLPVEVYITFGLTKMPRPVLAFLVAPLVGLCGAALLTWLLFSFNGTVTLPYTPFLVLGGAFFSYPFLLVVGVPIFLLLRRYRITALWVYVGFGVLFGFIGWMVASSPIPSPELHTRALSELFFGVCAGALGAAVFRRIAGERGEASQETPDN